MTPPPLLPTTPGCNYRRGRTVVSELARLEPIRPERKGTLMCPKCGKPREYRLCLNHFHDPEPEITSADLENNAPLRALNPQVLSPSFSMKPACLTGTQYERLYAFAETFSDTRDLAPQPHYEMCEYLEQTVKRLSIPVGRRCRLSGCSWCREAA